MKIKREKKMRNFYLLIAAVVLLSSPALADQITRELHITRVFAEGLIVRGFMWPNDFRSVSGE